MIQPVTMAPQTAAKSGREPNSVVVFGSQGSKTLFSPSTARNALRNAMQSPLTIELLHKCHVAFQKDCRSLDRETQAELQLELSDFDQLTDFLNPKPAYHSNPIIQATTICLHQLLHYLGNVERSGLGYDVPRGTILETTGFCSGMLPACVVAYSQTPADFLSYGVGAMRFAFWVACRSALYTRQFSRGAEGSCSLVVIGQDRKTLEANIQAFINKSGHKSVHISAVVSEKSHSISGPHAILEDFKAYLGPKQYSQYAHVHGWYHGGRQLEKLADEVEHCLAESGASFPEYIDTRIRIRSSSDGSVLDQDTFANQTLARWVIRHMLVHTIDWVETSSRLCEAARANVEKTPGARLRIVSYGPNSEALFSNIRAAGGQSMDFADMSPFTAEDDTVEVEQDHIAIVGKAYQLPKARNDEELHDLLSSGTDAISEIPSSRFNWADYHDKTALSQARSMKTKKGVFLDNIWGFDHAFFNISPREAKSMDPQQRILLQVAKEALEDAGYVGDSTPTFKRSSMGCYVGLATGDYVDNLRDDIDVFYTPGTLRAFHSGRISFALKLGGPSMTSDTACSSSLVSIYQACRAIQNGDCTSAIAGGINTICSPDMYLGLATAHFLSTTGNCKPFDASADGYCRGEGCGMFVLKKLSDAIAENDRIYGVIKGVEVNHSGTASSITHPHSETQVKLINTVLEKADIDPASINVVEAHGTGTQAGDATEIKSLKEAFAGHHSTSRPIYVSSIKGNLGHSEAASGAAGLAKLLLMLNRKKIYRQANFRQLNPKLTDLESAGIVIPTTNSQWPGSSDTPRRALLNNFGASGSNAALVVEEFKASSKRRAQSLERSQYVFNLSTKTNKSLEILLKETKEAIVQLGDEVSLADICYTASARRQSYDYRISIPCVSKTDLLSKMELKDATSIKPVDKTSKPIIFVFSGQGSLYQGMGQELFATSAYFRQLIERCDDIVQGLGFLSFITYLENNNEEFERMSSEEQLIASQCGLVALEYSLASLFMSWGITPDYIVGHSLGEYAALAVSGALDIAEVLSIAAHRAKLLANQCHPGHWGMLALKASHSVTEDLLRGSPNMSKLEIACINSLERCVVSGPNDELFNLENLCAKDQINTKRLDVPFGFHSASMNPILEDLERLGKTLHWKKPKIQFVSTVFGKCVDAATFSGEYIAQHTRQPVSFVEAVQDIDREMDLTEATCFEIGPHPITTPMLREILYGRQMKPLGTLRRDQKAWVGISNCLSQCFTDGLPIDWRAVLKDTRANIVDLPGHPLQMTDAGVAYKEGVSKNAAEPQPEFNKSRYKLLPDNHSTISPLITMFTTGMDILTPFIAGHDVGGIPICPASVYHELCLEAAHIAEANQPDLWITVANMTFPNPLTLKNTSSSKGICVRVEKSSTDSTKRSVEVSEATNGSGQIFCTAELIVCNAKSMKKQWFREGAIATRQSQYLQSCPDVNRFNKRVLYEVVFTRVVKYSEEYQTISDLQVLESSREGLGKFKLTKSGLTDGYVVNPIFTDTLLHAAGFVANMNAKDDEIYICHHVESVDVDNSNLGAGDEYSVYTCLYEGTKGSFFADSTALDKNGVVVACIRGMHFKRIRKAGFQRAINHDQPQQVSEPRVETRAAAPAADPTPAKAADSQQQTDSSTMHAFVLETVGKVSGFPSDQLSPSQKLEALGIDSLMQIEMTSSLNNSIEGLQLDHNTIADCETIEDVQNLIASALPATSTSTEPSSKAASVVADETPKSSAESTPRSTPEPTNLRCLSRSDSSGTPICLIHDGSGQSSMYSRIGNVDRDVWAFNDPTFGSTGPGFDSLNEMAESYAEQLIKANLKSVILGGWSFGGVVAFEMSQQLSKHGIEVVGLILIDSPYPIGHDPLPEAIISGVIKGSGLNSASSSNNSFQKSLLEQFKRCAGLIGEYNPSSGVPVKTVVLHSQDTIDTQSLYGVEYEWLSGSETRASAIDGWRKLVGQDMSVLNIEGNHFEPFTGSYAEKTGAQIREACKVVDHGRGE